MDAHATQGRLLSRREILAWLGSASVFLALGNRSFAAENRPNCIAAPEQTEGPYFVDTGLERSDIRADQATGTTSPGVPLRLDFIVSSMDAAACQPLCKAHVELWHCDARGVYSGVRDPSFDARRQTYLRGYQQTDAAGKAQFVTIYPGWYPGRTVHLHFMVRTSAGGRPSVFTSQLYFSDALSDRVFAAAPYSARAPRGLKNGGDGIFRRGGSQLLLDVQERNEELTATFHLGLRTAS